MGDGHVCHCCPQSVEVVLHSVKATTALKQAGRAEAQVQAEAGRIKLKLRFKLKQQDQAEASSCPAT
jgi:hypothetical protein